LGTAAGESQVEAEPRGGTRSAAKLKSHGESGVVKKNPRTGVKTIGIGAAILAMLLLLAQLYRGPASSARDRVFGVLGRVHPAVTNLTESSTEPSIAATNGGRPVTTTPPAPTIESNTSTAQAPPAQATNDAMANAVAAALAAPPLVRGQQSSPPDIAAGQSPEAASEGRPVVTAYVPAPPPKLLPPPEPYTPAPTPEPASKLSTASLLASVKGIAPPAADNGSNSTALLLGVETGESAQPDAASNVAVAAVQRSPADAAVSGWLSVTTNVSFVVDQSLRMKKDGKPERARVELLKILESLGSGRTFYILFFHSDGFEEMPDVGPVTATRGNIQGMTNWLFSAGHRFGSDPVRAIRRALEMIPSPDTVWLISDGEFPKTAIQSIREANANVNARINTIALGSADGAQVMRQIADENRGHSRYIAPPP
jgi:hypothetical protein